MERRQRVDHLPRAVSIRASSSKAKESVISSGKTGTPRGTNTLLPQEDHAVSVEVGSSLMRFIKGRGGSTQKKIEDDLEVKLIFPSSRKEDRIRIEGKSREAVSRALEKIQIIIKEAVESPSLDYSHFVSLPLAIHPELVDQLFKFQNSILGDGSSKALINVEDKLNVQDNSKRVAVNVSGIPIVSYPPKESESSSLSNLGIDKSIFINPRTFHLTVLMLKLWNPDRVNAARGVLTSISSEVKDALENRPVFIRLKGLLGELSFHPQSCLEYIRRSLNILELSSSSL